MRRIYDRSLSNLSLNGRYTSVIFDVLEVEGLFLPAMPWQRAEMPAVATRELVFGNAHVEFGNTFEERLKENVKERS